MSQFKLLDDRLYWGERWVHLRQQEVRLMTLLLQHEGRVARHRDLEHALFHDSMADPIDKHGIVRTRIYDLRQHIAELCGCDPLKLIESVTGVGYRLNAP